jgi:hypothetical protein
MAAPVSVLSLVVNSPTGFLLSDPREATLRSSGVNNISLGWQDGGMQQFNFSILDSDGMTPGPMYSLIIVVDNPRPSTHWWAVVTPPEVNSTFITDTSPASSRLFVLPYTAAFQYASIQLTLFEGATVQPAWLSPVFTIGRSNSVSSYNFTIISEDQFATQVVSLSFFTQAAPLYESHWNLTAHSVGSQPVSLFLDSASAASVTTIHLNFSHVPIDSNVLIAWMSGDNCAQTPSSAGSGTLLTPSDSASPKARRNSIFWTSPEGHLYIYGGYASGVLTDVWRYTTYTRQWQWICGSSTATSNNNAVYSPRRVESAAAATSESVNLCSAVDPHTGYVYIFGGGGGPLSGQLQRRAGME